MDPSSSSSRPPRLLVYAAAGFLVLTVAAFVRGGLSRAPDSKVAEVPVVTARAPGLREVIDVVTFTGAIAARDEIPVSPEGEGGRVSAVLVEVGDQVRRGQVLARLDPSVATPQVGSLQAALDEAVANAELAESDFKRAQAVERSGALSAEEIERRRSAAIAGRARVQVAKAQLAESRARLNRTEIRAPGDGIVLTREVEVGQTVTAGSAPIFRLGRGGEIEMRGRIAEQDLPKLSVGQTARVRVTGLEQAFPGRVRLLGAVIDPETRLGSIRIDLEAHPNLRPGAFARGEVETGRARRAIVAQTAVLSDASGSHVLAVDDANVVRRIDVRVAGTREGGVVIASGLTGTERIVTTAAAYLRVGEIVKLAPTTAAPVVPRAGSVASVPAAGEAR